MSKLLSICLVLVLASITRLEAQNVVPSEYLGQWILYKAEQYSEFNREGKEIPLPFIELEITDINLKLHSSLILSNAFELDYKYKNGVFIHHKLTKFEVESFQNDTLIINQFLNTESYINKYYLVNKAKVFKEFFSKFEYQSEFTANSFVTPRLYKSIKVAIDAYRLNENGEAISGYINYYTREKKIKTEILESKFHKKALTKLIIKYLNGSHYLWDMRYFEQFDIVRIPFVLVLSNDGGSLSQTFFYFTTDIEKVLNMNNINLNWHDVIRSNEYFIKGLKYFEKNKLDKALSNFEKAFELSNDNYDALFNIGVIHFQQGNKEKACETWKSLYDVNYEPAIQVYNDNCQ